MKFEEFIQSEFAKKPHYLLFGHPVSHSLSPVMHNIALKSHGINAEYVAVDLQPNQLPSAFAWLNEPMFKGCNITIPYKEDFYAAVDSLNPESQEMGVINTVVKKDDGSIMGANTDPYGFIKPLEQYTGELEGETAILFGSGGASKAVICALTNAGMEHIVLVSRTPQNLNPFQQNIDITVTDYSGWQAYAKGAVLLVNSTPLGMGDFSGKSPVRDDEYSLFNGKICYDLIYNPAETPFLKISAHHGAVVMNGLEMLIHQGNRSFQLWTGKEFPVEQIREELKKRLGQ